MAKLDLVSNNQERENKSEEDCLWERSEDVTFNHPSCPSSGAIFRSPHSGGDLAQEMAEDKTHNNSLPLVPSGHHSASSVEGRKAAKGRKDNKERVNDIIRELLFNSGLCWSRR